MLEANPALSKSPCALSCHVSPCMVLQEFVLEAGGRDKRLQLDQQWLQQQQQLAFTAWGPASSTPAWSPHMHAFCWAAPLKANLETSTW